MIFWGQNRVRIFRTLKARLLVVSVFVTLIALVIVGFALSFSFRSYALDDIDRRLENVLDTMIGASEIGPDGILRFTRPLFDQRFADPYSGWYWQISERGEEAFRSRSLWDFELVPDLSDPVFGLMVHEHMGPDAQILRVVERDIILPEADRVFRYMVAADTLEVRRAIDRFNTILIGALALITLAIAVSLLVQLSVALRPLRQIRRELGDVRAGRKKTMSFDYPDDLKPLAVEIDALIKHNDQLLERARRHVGNLAHGVKTPISVIRNEIDSIKGVEGERIKGQLEEMINQIDHHLRRARVSGSFRGAGVDAGKRIKKMAHVVGRLYGDKDLNILTKVDAGLFFGGEQQDFDEIVGNLIENAGKWAKNTVSVSARRARSAHQTDSAHQTRSRDTVSFFELIVEDDGPGVPPGEYDRLFERGRRLDESVPGTGLGLAIVRDITDLYRGSCHIQKSGLGGLQVTVTLPLKPDH